MKKATRVLGLAMAGMMLFGLLLAAPVMAAEKGKNNQDTITGVVEKGDKGISMIRTEDGKTFTIIGKNMAEMTGKTVKVTGMLTKGSKNRSVVVTTFEEISN